LNQAAAGWQRLEGPSITPAAGLNELLGAIVYELNCKFPNASGWRVCLELALNYCQLVLAPDWTEYESPKNSKQRIKHHVHRDKADGDTRVEEKKWDAWKRGERNVLDGDK